MYQPALPSDPALFLWAEHIGRATEGTISPDFDRQLANVGPYMEQYVQGSYRSGDPLPVVTMLDILELSVTARLVVSPADERRELVRVWERLGDVYGVRQGPHALVGGRADLILALNALLMTDNPPPAVERYVPVLDAELAALNWTILGQLSPDRALHIEQIEEDWRTCEVYELEDLDKA